MVLQLKCTCAYASLNVAVDAISRQAPSRNPGFVATFARQAQVHAVEHKSGGSVIEGDADLAKCHLVRERKHQGQDPDNAANNECDSVSTNFRYHVRNPKVIRAEFTCLKTAHAMLLYYYITDN